MPEVRGHRLAVHDVLGPMVFFSFFSGSKAWAAEPGSYDIRRRVCHTATFTCCQPPLRLGQWIDDA